MHNMIRKYKVEKDEEILKLNRELECLKNSIVQYTNENEQLKHCNDDITDENVQLKFDIKLLNESKKTANNDLFSDQLMEFINMISIINNNLAELNSQNKVLFKENEEFKNQISEFSMKYNEILRCEMNQNNQLNELKIENEQLLDQLAQIKKENSTQCTKLNDLITIENEFISIKNELDDYQKKLKIEEAINFELKEDIDYLVFLKTENDHFKQNITEFETAIINKDSEIESLKKIIDDNQSKINELSGMNSILSKENYTLTEDIKQFQLNENQLKESLLNLQNEKSELSAKYERSITEYEHQLKVIKSEKDDLKIQINNYSNCQKYFQEIGDKLSDLVNTRNVEFENLKNIKNSFEELEKNYNELKKRYDDLEQVNVDLKKQVNDMEKVNTELKDNSDKVIKECEELKKVNLAMIKKCDSIQSELNKLNELKKDSDKKLSKIILPNTEVTKKVQFSNEIKTYDISQEDRSNTRYRTIRNSRAKLPITNDTNYRRANFDKAPTSPNSKNNNQDFSWADKIYSFDE